MAIKEYVAVDPPYFHSEVEHVGAGCEFDVVGVNVLSSQRQRSSCLVALSDPAPGLDWIGFLPGQQRINVSGGLAIILAAFGGVWVLPGDDVGR